MIATWGSPFVRMFYATEGWSDPGEALAFAKLLPLASGARVLDIGVGGGRTTGFLASADVSYLGIDSSPEMLELARRRYPTADLRLGDAADLGGLDSAAFDLVLFSLNGLDCLAHDQRSVFLKEVHRILAPGGVLVFSTHNLDGPSYDVRPRGLGLRTAAQRSHGLGVVKSLGLATLRHALARWHYPRTVVRAERHDDWALAPMRSHEFRFVVHFATFGAVRRQLADSGFEVEGAWTNTGRALALDADSHDDDYATVRCHSAG